VIAQRLPPKPSRGEKLFPSALPSLFYCALPLAGYVSGNTVIAAKSRRCAVPSVRVTTRANYRAVFHLSSGVILEPASDLYFTTLLVLFLIF
jgi:hypothetical protein